MTFFFLQRYVVAKNEVAEDCGFGFKILKARREVYFYYRCIALRSIIDSLKPTFQSHIVPLHSAVAA